MLGEGYKVMFIEKALHSCVLRELYGDVCWERVVWWCMLGEGHMVMGSHLLCCRSSAAVS